MDPNNKQNKGKSASASISNIAIRFHADDEELEEVVQPNTALSTTSDKQSQNVSETVEEENSSISSSQQSTPTSTTDSQSYLTRLGKRSSSLESASPSENSSGDAWRLFRDFRGRITKTVEEKLEEIKSDRLKGSRGRQRRRPNLGSKVENSSISDSEDQSEGSFSVSLKANESGENQLLGDGDKRDRETDEDAKSMDRLPNDPSGERLVASPSSDPPKDDYRPSSPVVEKGDLPSPSPDKSCGILRKRNKSENGEKTKESKVEIIEEDSRKKTKKEKQDDGGKNEDESVTKKEKKTRTRFFGDRFSRSPDKKNPEVSMKFSTLKNDESEDELISLIEYGTEALSEESLGVPLDGWRAPLRTAAVSSAAAGGECDRNSVITRTRIFLWRWKMALAIAGIVVAYRTFHPQVGSTAFGFAAGVLATVVATRAYRWLHDSIGPSGNASPGSAFDRKSVYGDNVFPIFSCSHFIEPLDKPEKVVYEGWINEYSQEYSPDTYHICLTETVHIRLEGSMLQLSSPSTKIPKRAHWSEPEHKKLFNRQRLFDIAGCKVQLLPVGLIHKRAWSKKYPICITLLKMSRLGVRHRTKGKITIEDDSPWLDAELDDTTPTPTDEQLPGLPLSKEDEDNFEECLSQESDILKAQANEPPNAQQPDNISLRPSVTFDPTHSICTENDEEDDVEDEDFVRISPSLLHEFNLYLFARTDRQKEIWYRRLSAATSMHRSPSDRPARPPEEVVEAQSSTDQPLSEVSETSLSPSLASGPPAEDRDRQRPSVPAAEESPMTFRRNREKKYLDYMNSLAQKRVTSLQNFKERDSKQLPPSSSSSSSKSLAAAEEDSVRPCEEVMWVNAFGGRILYDVLYNPFWLGKIQEKFQRKLSAIKLPVFMEGLVISSINYGETVPLVQNASRPVLNEDGIWVDLDVIYEGSFCLTIDTKLNLMKLKKDLDSSSSVAANAPLSRLDTADVLTGSNTTLDSSSQFDVPPATSSAAKFQKSAVFDSDVEDSAESSSEEPDSVRVMGSMPDMTPSSPGGTTSSSKMLRMVDRITASKYFQQVTDNKFIKRAMEGVSNTNIALIVEVKGLAGTLVLNFPPPPSDRLWYGFRGHPKLWITAQPKVGERMVTMLHITSWIEKRLVKEFQKILVLPNMDDLVIPVMDTELPS